MNASNLKELLQYCYISNKAVLINGKHGIGKSSIVKQFGNENNLNVEILNLSLMEPSDLLGMPDVDKSQEHPRTIWLEPEWFQRIVDKAWPVNFTFEDLEFNDLEFKEVVINKFKNNIENIENIKRKDLNGLYCSYYKTTEGILSNQNNVRCEKSQKSILFLDELNRASPDTRQPALQLTLDKKLQCHELPYVDGKCTFIVSAINPSDLYQTDDLDTALLDRFLLVDLEVSVQDWLKYATSCEIIPSIIEFITENSDRLHFMPEEGKGSSPRAWEELSDILKNDIKNQIVLSGIMQGKLGKEVGSLFYVYYKKYNELFKIDDLLQIVFENSKKSIKEISDIIKEKTNDLETIRKHSLLNQLFVLATNELKSKEYNIMSLSLLSFLSSLNFEISLMFTKKLQNESPELYEDLASLDAKLNSKKFFSEIIKYTR